MKHGDQCDHVEKVGSVFTGYRKVRCEVKHMERVDGKPQMLYQVKKQLFCRKHLPPNLLARMGFK